MRGSTHRGWCAGPRREVRPAHAGIDLRCILLGVDDRGPPRACGDRPYQAIKSMADIGSAPRMRGSTPAIESIGGAANVRPAHAGIDPTALTATPPLVCPPRACGDRPLLREVQAARGGSAPRMRGSTQRRRWPALAGRVRPAHAGIDPKPAAACCRGWCPPRACGDRPAVHVHLVAHPRSAPRMRGSTSHPAAAPWPPQVCPAHAGIDPAPAAYDMVRLRLPRACGDRPYQAIKSMADIGSAPRMRGST